jgi:nuclear transport factor 2 (NTF2) superfamily protein
MRFQHDSLVRAACEAFNHRDVDAVLVCLSPDVAWANGMEGGFVHGHDAVRDYWTGQ